PVQPAREWPRPDDPTSGCESRGGYPADRPAWSSPRLRPLVQVGVGSGPVRSHHRAVHHQDPHEDAVRLRAGEPGPQVAGVAVAEPFVSEGPHHAEYPTAGESVADGHGPL